MVSTGEAAKVLFLKVMKNKMLSLSRYAHQITHKWIHYEERLDLMKHKSMHKRETELAVFDKAIYESSGCLVCTKSHTHQCAF
jgi:hypothetical protein